MRNEWKDSFHRNPRHLISRAPPSSSSAKLRNSRAAFIYRSNFSQDSPTFEQRGLMPVLARFLSSRNAPCNLSTSTNLAVQLISYYRHRSTSYNYSYLIRFFNRGKFKPLNGIIPVAIQFHTNNFYVPTFERSCSAFLISFF